MSFVPDCPTNDAAAELVSLADWYAQKGLVHAALSAYKRAGQLADVTDGVPLARLANLQIALDLPGEALKSAKSSVAIAATAQSYLLVGRANIANKNYDAARQSFLLAKNLAESSYIDLLAQRGQARACMLAGDNVGAAALAVEGASRMVNSPLSPDCFEGLPEEDTTALRGGPVPDRQFVEMTLFEGFCEVALRCGAQSDMVALLKDNMGSRTVLFRGIVSLATIKGADNSEAPGETLSVGSADTVAQTGAFSQTKSSPNSLWNSEQEISDYLQQHPHSVAARILFLRHKLSTVGKRQPRKKTIDDVRSVLLLDTSQTLASEPMLGAALWHRVAAELLATDPSTHEEARKEYQQVLQRNPTQLSVACRLAQLQLAAGDACDALASVVHALHIDAEDPLAWQCAAKVLQESSFSVWHTQVGALLEAAAPGSDIALLSVLPLLLQSVGDAAKQQLLRGMQMRSHRVKNRLSVIAARLRSLRKSTEKKMKETAGTAVDTIGNKDTISAMKLVESEVQDLYQEWSQYLRVMTKQKMGMRVVSLHRLLSDICVSIEVPPQVVVRTTQDVSVPSVRGDSLLLSEALENIITNAVDACGDSGVVAIHLGTERRRGTPFVRIQISDTGTGMSPDQIRRAFAPGYTTKPQGSGLGLAVAKQVILAHQGTLGIQSVLGDGTQIDVVMPCDFATTGMDEVQG